MTTQISRDATCAASLEPARVVEARYLVLDSVLYLRFEDGLERAVRWAELPFAGRLGFSPVALSVGQDGTSVGITDEAGREVHISVSSLRAALDEGYRAQILAADDSERRLVGARLRVVRASLKLSQLELSRRSGVPQESLSRIETGRRDPRLGTLRKLARGMDLSLDQLLERLSAGA